LVKPDLVAQLGDRRPDALHRNARTAQRAEHEGFGEADERHRRAAPGTWEHRDQRIAVLRVRPGMKRGEGRVEVRRTLAQREQRDAETGIVAPQRASECRGPGQIAIVLGAPVVAGERLYCAGPAVSAQVTTGDRLCLRLDAA